MFRKKALLVLSAFLCVLGGNAARAACTLPNTLTNGQTADATQVMADFNALVTCLNAAGPGGSSNSIQYNNGSGALAGVGPLTDGQLVVGATGGAPQAQTLTAGSGITVTNGPGSITISSTGGAGGSVSPFYDASVIPLTKPTASSFTVANSTGNTGTLTDMASRGVTLSTPGVGSATTTMEQPIANSTTFTVTTLVYPVGYLNGNWFWGICVKDTSGKYAAFGFRNQTPVSYFKFSNISTYNSSSTSTGIVNAQNPIWLKLQAAGGTFTFSFSFDGEHFNPGWSVSMTDYLTSSLSSVGILILNNSTGQALPLDVLSWTNATP
ncbi:MAG: hypothetical protein E5X33_29715 [Mesorhizobium sp.]|uniref:hypothetical protein n=1 Tax=Mesorhizobium sp. TaxID=1871066 RepID=UPI00121251FC|nr:hypothetical protein [Mesorhizobium sp.]TIR16166.1 MAG: hypothetical protein E5X33_29715 [Mesorhizobium sp.]